MASSQDVNTTATKHEHGRPRFPLLEDVLPIPVVPYMDKSGQPLQVANLKVLEELDPLEKVSEILADPPGSRQ
jgi:hypothetical protein